MKIGEGVGKEEGGRYVWWSKVLVKLSWTQGYLMACSLCSINC